MGLYDRDYMRWTPEERQRLGGGSPAPARNARLAIVVAALVTLAASVVGAKLGLGFSIPGLHDGPAAPARPAPIGCVGPSSEPCPPGSVRIRDPIDPDNPNEWPNDLPRSQAPAPSV